MGIIHEFRHCAKGGENENKLCFHSRKRAESGCERIKIRAIMAVKIGEIERDISAKTTGVF